MVLYQYIQYTSHHIYTTLTNIISLQIHPNQCRYNYSTLANSHLLVPPPISSRSNLQKHEQGRKCFFRGWGGWWWVTGYSINTVRGVVTGYSINTVRGVVTGYSINTVNWMFWCFTKNSNSCMAFSCFLVILCHFSPFSFMNWRSFKQAKYNIHLSELKARFSIKFYTSHHNQPISILNTESTSRSF